MALTKETKEKKKILEMRTVNISGTILLRIYKSRN